MFVNSSLQATTFSSTVLSRFVVDVPRIVLV